MNFTRRMVRETPINEAFARAADIAARDLAAHCGQGVDFSESRLAEALAGGLRQQGLEALTGIHLPVPDWDPRPGGTDLMVGSRGSPTGLAELKVSRPGRQPTLFEALWDALKLAAQVGRTAASDPVLRSVEGAYLMAAAPLDHWRGLPRASWHLRAGELFPGSAGGRFEDSCLALLERNRCAWEDLLWGGRARPQRIGHRIATEFVAAVPFECGRVAWELRCARVIAHDEEWLPFDGAWPRGLPP